MPHLHVDVTAQPHEGGPRVHIVCNSVRLASLGPFGSLEEAARAAERVIEEIERHAMSTLMATQADDIADK